VLATIKWETAGSYKALKEIGDSTRKETRYGGKGGNDEPGDGARYCGRGYIQLTYKGQYAALNKALDLEGTGNDIVVNPEKALDPVIAYRVCSYVMRNGTFTGKKLSDYIHDTTADYVSARKLINGFDHAPLIASEAMKFEKILRACLEIDRKAVGH
jgi:predicted chitinase